MIDRIIHPTVEIPASCSIGYFAVIEEGAVIGDGVEIGHHAVIHAGTRVGAGCKIADHAVLGKRPFVAKTSTLKHSDLSPLELGSGCIVGVGAVVYAGSVVNGDSMIADGAQVRERCLIGHSVIIGRGVTVENDSTVGDFTKLQTGAYITARSTLEENVFVAPGVNTSNDNFIGRTAERFKYLRGPCIRKGARIGVAAVLLPGVEIGQEAVVAAGAVVTRDVAPYKVVKGCPARASGDTPTDQLLYSRSTVEGP